MALGRGTSHHPKQPQHSSIHSAVGYGRPVVDLEGPADEDAAVRVAEVDSPTAEGCSLRMTAVRSAASSSGGEAEGVAYGVRGIARRAALWGLRAPAEAMSSGRGQPSETVEAVGVSSTSSAAPGPPMETQTTKAAPELPRLLGGGPAVDFCHPSIWAPCQQPGEWGAIAMPMIVGPGFIQPAMPMAMPQFVAVPMVMTMPASETGVAHGLPCGAAPWQRPPTVHGGSAGGPAAPEQRTTLMIRNLPNNYTRSDLMRLVDSKGFAGKYDFLYLPIDFRTRAGMGYAFLNMLTPEDAERLRKRLHGFSRWSVPSGKVCSVAWSHPHQGLQEHIDRYRNSPVMHEMVPEDFRPMMFRDGQPVPFPPPTRKIRLPRQGTQRVML